MSEPTFITKLSLKRFRSLPDETVEFDNPTLLVGKNGSGKSNFVDAIAFLCDCAVGPLQTALENRGGIRNVGYRTPVSRVAEAVGIRADFRLTHGIECFGHYSFELRTAGHYSFVVQHEQCVLTSEKGDRVWFDRDGQEFRTNLTGLEIAMDPQSLALPVVGGVRQLAPLRRAFASMRVYSLDPMVIRQIQDWDASPLLKRDGANVASVLRQLARRDPEVAERVSELLASIVPDIARVRPVQRSSKIGLEFTQQWDEQKSISFEAAAMSDGTMYSLGILVALMQQPTPPLIVIEEPEIMIHPGGLGTIQELIQIAARRSQVVITTHSPELLDAEWVGPENLRVVHWENGATRISRLSTGAVRA